MLVYPHTLSHASPRAHGHGRRTAGACAAAALAAATLFAASPAEAQFTRASLAHDGSEPNDHSIAGATSADGRVVAFASAATNLVPGDTNGAIDLFVRDLVANTVERIGETRAYLPMAISDNGDLVVFMSDASLVPEDPACTPGRGCTDIYSYHRPTQTLELLTRGIGGAAADNAVDEMSVSADGRLIAFSSPATNLVANDTNLRTDIFVVDSTTKIIRRVSVDANGAQGSETSHRPAISADGTVVGFGSYNTWGESRPCAANPCERVYLKTLATGAVERLPLEMPQYTGVLGLALDGQGKTAAVRSASVDRFSENKVVVIWRHDVPSGKTRIVLTTGDALPPNPPLRWSIALSRDGRYMAAGTVDQGLAFYDDVSGLTTDTGLAGVTFAQSNAFSGDGRSLLLSVAGPIAGDTNGKTDAYLYALDMDGDGLGNFWERDYGLDPTNPADGALDSDGDGATNLEEYQAGSHPTAAYTRHFAEGVSNDFFRTRFAFLNPTAVDARVTVRLFDEQGQSSTMTLVVPALRRRTESFTSTNVLVRGLQNDYLWPNIPSWQPGTSFSAIIESDQPVVADRLTTWGFSSSTDFGYGASLESSVPAPATTWHFAEGATGSGFSLYYLLSNPGEADASVAVDYLRADGLGTLTENVPVPAHTRVTLDVASRFPELVATTVSGRLTATQPIVAERAMYRSAPDQLYTAGHAGAGIVSPAPRWFLAEGATGFFDEYVLVSNPGATATNVRFTFLPGSGAAFDVTREVAANSRYTLDAKEFPALASATFSVIVESVEQTPIVVERVMWWPAGGPWYEASLSAGVTATGTKWAVAEGQQSASVKTYVLVANTDPARDGQAKITLLFEHDARREVTLDVPRNGRATLDVGDIPEANNRTFSIIVEGVDNLPIVVERSLYANSGGIVFAAGGSSVATNITPVP